MRQASRLFVTLENVSVTTFENDDAIDRPAIVNVVGVVDVAVDVSVLWYLKSIGIFYIPEISREKKDRLCFFVLSLAWNSYLILFFPCRY